MFPFGYQILTHNKHTCGISLKIMEMNQNSFGLFRFPTGKYVYNCVYINSYGFIVTISAQLLHHSCPLSKDNLYKVFKYFLKTI